MNTTTSPPTPETDAATFKILSSLQSGTEKVVYAEICAKLERERDEARDRAESKHGLWVAELSRVTELEKQLNAMREAIKEVFNSFADEDSAWLLDDLQTAALAKLQNLLP